MGLMDILKQYATGSSPSEEEVHGHFDAVATQASKDDLGSGIAAAFRSDATPPFEQAVGSLFGRSDPTQQAGLLNQLLPSLGSGALGGIAGGVLGRLIGSRASGTVVPTISPSQASQVSPDDVSALAAHAAGQDPSVIDRVGSFYAAHPTLVRTLGAVALSAVMGHINQRR